MRLQELTQDSKARSDFDSFIEEPSFARGEAAGAEVGTDRSLAQFDALESSSKLQLWSVPLRAFNPSLIAAAAEAIVLPPETPDQRRRRAERDISLGAPSFTHLDSTVPEADLDKRLADLEADVTRRAADYEGKFVSSLFSGFFGGKNDGLGKTYSDLTAAMKGDAAELAGWSGLNHDQKVDLYNRVAREANMEVKYNINLVYGNKRWSETDLNQLDAGLAKIPSSLVLDDDKLNNIRRFDVREDEDKNPVYAQALPNGDIEFSDLGVAAKYRFDALPGLTETIMHEVGHHFDDENPRWKEFMALSGWRDMGADTAFPAVKDGPAKGSDLGITDDPNGDYVVSRRYNHTYVHKQDAKFGRGDYTRNNPYDDFAETFMQYLHAPAELKMNAPEKFAFIKEFLKSRDADYDPSYVID